jgi:hypothetical protein
MIGLLMDNKLTLLLEPPSDLQVRAAISLGPAIIETSIEHSSSTETLVKAYGRRSRYKELDNVP